MATTIYLIRHGETVDADSRRYKGHIDVPLSENGIKQLERLAEYLYQNLKLKTQNLPTGQAGSKLKAVYCSGLSRAMKSAEIIARPYGIEPVIIENLKERSFGVWEGMTFDEIKEKWPDAFNAWAENPLKFSPMEGESTLEVRDRAMRAWNDILSRHNNQNTEHRTQSTDKDSLKSGFRDLDSENIAIVSHGGITRVILCEMLGMPLENIFRIEQDFAALNIIELWDYPIVKKINFRVQNTEQR